ncbi:hypothetical protein P9112_006743 [Eukaryota sp. TZLM1-RC]
MSDNLIPQPPEVIFPGGKIHRRLIGFHKQGRVSSSGAVYLASVLDTITTYLLEGASDICEKTAVGIIRPRHIILAIHESPELLRLLAPSIHELQEEED